MSEQRMPREMPLRAWPSLCLVLPWDINKSPPCSLIKWGNPEASLAAARVTLSVCMQVLPPSLRLFPEQGLQVPKPLS